MAKTEPLFAVDQQVVTGEVLKGAPAKSTHFRARLKWLPHSFDVVQEQLELYIADPFFALYYDGYTFGDSLPTNDRIERVGMDRWNGPHLHRLEFGTSGSFYTEVEKEGLRYDTDLARDTLTCSIRGRQHNSDPYFHLTDDYYTAFIDRFWLSGEVVAEYTFRPDTRSYPFFTRKEVRDTDGSFTHIWYAGKFVEFLGIVPTQTQFNDYVTTGTQDRTIDPVYIDEAGLASDIGDERFPSIRERFLTSGQPNSDFAAAVELTALSGETIEYDATLIPSLTIAELTASEPPSTAVRCRVVIDWVCRQGFAPPT